MTATREPLLSADTLAPARPRLRDEDTGRDVLAALRLVARGLSPVEIAAQQRCSLVDVLRDLQGALTVLDGATVSEAIAMAKQRGLID